MKNDNFGLIIQARMGSNRLPGKVRKFIGDKEVIDFLIDRLCGLNHNIKIIVATSNDKSNDSLCLKLKNQNIPYFRGSEYNVLDRFFQAATKYKFNNIIRITADCPFHDPNLIDEMIQFYLKEKLTYCSNIDPPSYPDGFDIEIFTYKELANAFKNASDKYDMEHVTPYIRREAVSKKNYVLQYGDLSHLRLTLDENDDLKLLNNIFNFFQSYSFSLKDIIKLYENNPLIFEANKYINRNENDHMTSGQKLWQKAKKLILGGNMLLSKRPDLFLPNKWPTYYSKAKGCNVWDLDGNKYIDFSIMSVGTNILGYANSFVDKEVKKSIGKSNMSSLNSPYEVYLAEKLIELHPWASKVKFSRSGGEANSMAIRIARAATGKEKVAICGYHGWHDWYLSANLASNSELDGHLLPGLEPSGVPRSLMGTTIPFEYNNIESFRKIIIENKNNLAAVKMEVTRSDGPEKGFLEEIRKVTKDEGIILIFDECTSGFRETYGGIHLKHNIFPDMAMFGKALGNGYAITSVIGKEEVMDAAQKSFISSTFWTEQIGPVAALATLQEMNKLRSWEFITHLGEYLQQSLLSVAKRNNLDITISGIPALTNFSINHPEWLKIKTFFTQEMLKKGFLASNVVYLSTAHSKSLVNNFINEADLIFYQISKCLNEQKDINQLLESDICISGFKRLN